MKKTIISTVLLFTVTVGFGIAERAAAGNLDAASFSGTEGFNNKIYLFKGRDYWRWNMETDVLDKNYPKYIRNGWSGVPNDIDGATFSGDNSKYPNKIYLFKGDQYWRWDMVRDELEGGYPKRIRDGWPGIPNNIDAVTFSGTDGFYNKIYFFKGDQYWRWDMETDTLDDGYPMDIDLGWMGIPNNLDAAVFSGFDSSYSHKIYFFKGDEYWRWDMQDDELDANYPRKIRSGWPGIPTGSNPSMTPN